MIQINSVLQNVPTKEKEKVERKRVIWITPDNEHVFLVDLEGKGFPYLTTVSELEIGLATENLLIVPDPYARVLRDEDISLPLRETRDRDWGIIQYLWTNNEQLILSQKTRSVLIKEACEKFSIPKYKIDRILKRFWQRGMTKNALLLDYSNCGNRGQEREAKEKKRGRPPKYREPGKEGINIDNTIKQLFRKVIDKQYRTKKKKYLTEAYDFLLQEYFSDPYIENGVQKKKIWSKDRIPTYTQFYYWYKKEYDFKEDYIKRYGETKFNLKHRELPGDSTTGAFAPGSQYQVDATVADVYLVSSLDRTKVIGRPIVYMALDVFSRMVAGMYVGLEGPSWIGAMMLMDNVVADKVHFCREYGIEITDEEWPCRYLPEIIIADRGEFEGYNAESLINNLNVQVDNTPPRRADMKGIVERHFRTTNERIKHTTPGAIEREYRQRCEEDPRLKAELTLREITAFIIIDVLWHNKHINETYPLSKGMLADGVLPRPIDMWRWGTRNRKGSFPDFNRDIVRLNLLPREEVSVSRSGIKFEDRYYSLGKAVSEGWFVNSKGKRIEIAYDPRNLNYIYLPSKDGKTFDVANLLEKRSMYSGLYWEEARFHMELKQENIEEARDDENQNNADRDLAINRILKKAKEETNKHKRAKGKTSKSKKTKEIGLNRSREKEMQREKESFILGPTQPTPQTTQVISINNPKDESDSGKEDKERMLAKLKKMRGRKFGEDGD